MSANAQQHRVILQSVAQQVMLERDLLPEFSAEAFAELGKIQARRRLSDHAGNLVTAQTPIWEKPE